MHVSINLFISILRSCLVLVLVRRLIQVLLCNGIETIVLRTNCRHRYLSRRKHLSLSTGGGFLLLSAVIY